MTGVAVGARGAAYRDRAERAAHLAGERPHASEILALYGAVLTLQEPLFERALEVGGTLDRALPDLMPGRTSGSASGTDPRRLPIERLPYAELDRLFVGFVADLSSATGDALAEAGTAVLQAPAGVRAELLRRTACQGDLDAIGAGLGFVAPDRPPQGLAFYSRAFLQPLVEALAESTEGEVEDVSEVCPRCGWPPQASVLRDDGDTQGRRTLVCGLCATEWPFPRVRCPSCGETDAGHLVLHEAESVPALRVAECEACQAYLKEVDLRRDGHGMPVVDDLATPELDLWAEQRGLWKICRNLVGL